MGLGLGLRVGVGVSARVGWEPLLLHDARHGDGCDGGSGCGWIWGGNPIKSKLELPGWFPEQTCSKRETRLDALSLRTTVVNVAAKDERYESVNSKSTRAGCEMQRALLGR